MLGFPCNQFGARSRAPRRRSPTFCETNYGVTFPMFAKIEVNGDGRHPLYEELTADADAEGQAGDIRWNFEKFLVSRDGEVVRRFRPLTTPEVRRSSRDRGAARRQVTRALPTHPKAEHRLHARDGQAATVAVGEIDAL